MGACFKNMSTDLDELKALVATLKADQQAQKDKEKRDAWTKYWACLEKVDTNLGGFDVL